MQIISHRGFWITPDEKNTKHAFLRSFKNGFGVETDIRDYSGHLVITHDCPKGDELSFADFCSLYVQFENFSDMPLAINIKSDGLHNLLKKELTHFNITNYFVFDMSIPDTLPYLSNDVIFFTRQSDIEPKPALYSQARGVWLDCFNSDWFSDEDIMVHINANKLVALVSPELHGRDYMKLWERLNNFSTTQSENLILCTDFPQQAKEYFYV